MARSTTEAAIRISLKGAPEVIRGLKGIGDAIERIGEKSTKTRPRLTGLTTSLTKMSAIAIGAAAGIAALFAKMSVLSGEVQRARVMFRAYVQAIRNVDEEFKNTYKSADELTAAIKDATWGLATVTDIAKMGTNAISMLGTQVGKKLPQMFKAATVASMQTGRSLEASMRSLILASGKMSWYYFKQLNLVVDVNQVYDEYADNIGTVAENLTKQQQATAVLDKAIELLLARAESLGDANLLLSIRTGAIKASFIDLKDSILEQLAPAFAVLAGKIQDFTDKAIPRIESFVAGFLAPFYQIPEGAIDAVDEGAAQMGNRAGQWAISAASWGANIGADFAIGILDGFVAVITWVMNTIAGILASWMKGRSPPKVAPELVQWGRDAIAEWAKGLSTLDLDFLALKVDMELRKALETRDLFKDKLSKERDELFKLQVLNKDPAAIRNQLAKVRASEAAAEAQEREVDALEKRRDEIREQLRLLRLLERLVDKTSGGGGGGGRRGGGGEGPTEPPFGAFDFTGGGLSNVQGQMTRFAETLGIIFDEPLARLSESWETNLDKIETAWKNLKTQIDATGLLAFLDDPALSAGVARVAGLALGFALAGKAVSILLKPLSILTGLLVVLTGAMDQWITKQYPYLSTNLSIWEKFLIFAGLAAQTVRAAVGIIGIEAAKLASKLYEVAANVSQFFQNLLVGAGRATGKGPFYFAKEIQGLQEFETTMRTAAENIVPDITDLAVDYQLDFGSLMDVVELAAKGEEARKILALQDLDLSMYGTLEETLTDTDLNFSALTTNLSEYISTWTEDMGTWSGDAVGFFNDFKRDVIDAGGIYPTALGEITRSTETQMGTAASLMEIETTRMTLGVDSVTASIYALISAMTQLGNTKMPNLPSDWRGHSPPPIAVGLKLINDELEKTRYLLRGNSGGSMGGNTTYNSNTFSEPLIGTIVVPNMAVGKQVARDLSEEIGRMTAARRMPA